MPLTRKFPSRSRADDFFAVSITAEGFRTSRQVDSDPSPADDAILVTQADFSPRVDSLVC